MSPINLSLVNNIIIYLGDIFHNIHTNIYIVIILYNIYNIIYIKYIIIYIIKFYYYRAIGP